MDTDFLCDVREDFNDTFLGVEGVDYVALDDCGLFASCVESICICAGSWKRSPAVSFNNFSTNELGPYCNTNLSLIRALYVFEGLVALSAIIWYTCKCSSWKEPTRLLLSFLGFVFYFVLAMLSVSDPENKLFGTDVTATVVGIIAGLLFTLAMWSYIQKLLLYELRRIPDGSGMSHEHASRLLKLHYLVLGLAVCSVTLQVARPLVRDRETQVIILQLGSTVFIVSVVFLVGMILILLGSLIKRMEAIISRHSSSSNAHSKNMDNSLLLSKLKSSLPKIKRLKHAILFGGLILGLFIVPSWFSTSWYNALKYILPLCFCVFILTVLSSEWLIQTAKKVTENNLAVKPNSFNYSKL